MGRLRTGDKAILVGVVAIASYEKWVRDDADLISRRVSAYRRNRVGRLITDAIILATALHLAEMVRKDVDIFHIAVGHFRRKSV